MCLDLKQIRGNMHIRKKRAKFQKLVEPLKKGRNCSLPLPLPQKAFRPPLQQKNEMPFYSIIGFLDLAIFPKMNRGELESRPLFFQAPRPC